VATVVFPVPPFPLATAILLTLNIVKLLYHNLYAPYAHVV